MKNTLAIVALSLTVGYTGFSQGEVLLENGNHAQISGNSAVGGPATGVLAYGGSVSVYYYALYNSVSSTFVAGSSATAVLPTGPTTPGSYAFQDSNWSFDAYGVSGSSPGKFSALTPDSNGDTQVPGVSIGSSSQFVIVGWSGNIGSTINSVESWLAGNEGAITGWIGESAVSGAIPTGSGATGSQTPPPELVTGGAPELSAWTLGEYTPVPEPSTIALGVMGAASLLALRRKKA